jgi:hypothetical protein
LLFNYVDETAGTGLHGNSPGYAIQTARAALHASFGKSMCTLAVAAHCVALLRADFYAIAAANTLLGIGGYHSNYLHKKLIAI